MKPTQLNRFLPVAALAGLSLFGTLQAATIVWDFNDNDGVVDANGLSGIGVTAGPATFTTAGNNTASFDRNRAQRDLGSQQGSETATFFFTINIPSSTTVSLTSLSFLQGLDVNSGSVNNNYFKWDLVITTTGSETPGASQTTFAQSQVGSNADITFNEAATLSGLDNLTNVDVTFAFTGHYGTLADYTGGSNTGRWIYLDNMTFTGEAIPEPSAALLGGIGMLALLRRRR